MILLIYAHYDQMYFIIFEYNFAKFFKLIFIRISNLIIY